MTYEHRQVAPLYLVLLGTAAGTLAIALAVGLRAVLFIDGGVAALLVVLAFSFRHMVVRDEGDRLAIRFGPLPLFRASIRYDQITGVEVGRSSWIDGWGIHYFPGRGRTYNLWGFSCVVIRVGKRVVRVGTDDAAGLAEFLRGRIERRG